MRRIDFANQFNKISQNSTNDSFLVLPVVFFTLLTAIFLIFLLPSNKNIKIYQSQLSPSNYQTLLNNYLQILEQYPNNSLPAYSEENLRLAAKKALVLSSEAKIYYPQNNSLTSINRQLEEKISDKFPELIAKK